MIIDLEQRKKLKETMGVSPYSEALIEGLTEEEVSKVYDELQGSLLKFVEEHERCSKIVANLVAEEVEKTGSMMLLLAMISYIDGAPTKNHDDILAAELARYVEEAIKKVKEG